MPTTHLPMEKSKVTDNQLVMVPCMMEMSDRFGSYSRLKYAEKKMGRN